MYLSSLQIGLQSAHVATEISIKYNQDTPQHTMFVDWATNHKTMIFLNGGNQNQLFDLEHVITNEYDHYPFASFYEDKESLNGCLTSIGIILPESVYNAEICDQIGNVIPHDLCNPPISQVDWELKSLLRSYQLAR